MDATKARRFLLELRFRNTARARRIVACLSQNFSVTLVRGRVSDAAAWYRFDLVGDVRRIDALRFLGARHGFAVGPVTEVAA